MPSAIGNFFVKTIVTSPLHHLFGDSLAVITVTGRKTGKHYSTPVNVVNDGDHFTIVSMRSRSWWRNLRGGAPATLRVSGQQHIIHSEVIEGRDEVIEGLRCYFKQHPDYAKYFGVRLAPDREPLTEDLEHAADEQVIVRLHFD
jgi:deazaflavin-dependent oxidoreductase (nitroreductase family)